MKKNKITKNIFRILIEIMAYTWPVLWLLSITTGALEVYFYPGFIYKHFHVDAFFVYLIFGVVGLYFQSGPDRNKKLYFRLFRYVNYLAISIFGLIYIYFNVLEGLHYPNYVFSNYHINPRQIATLVTLCIYTILISSKVIYLNISTILKTKLPIIIFVLWILISEVVDVTTTAIENLSYIVVNPRATYDQKMEFKVGKQFYDYVSFVRNNTSENSIILIPPQAYPWPQTGNIPYMRYFLYPRTLINGEEYQPGYDINRIDYILIDWGETVATSGGYTHGWPKFNVKADSMIYFTSSSLQAHTTGDYVYNNVQNKELWGVIKVKK